MTTVRTICTKSLRRLGVVDILETPSAESMASARDALNDMLQSWLAQGINCLPETFGLDDAFVMFVPPSDVDSGTLDGLTYVSTWNASTNSPALASATGTEGYVYKVSTAGSTTLDAVTSWSVGDYAIYNGTEWLKSKTVARHEASVIALLAVRLADDYGMQAPDGVKRDAMRGWSAMLSDYVKPPVATFDSGLLVTSASRTYGTID